MKKMKKDYEGMYRINKTPRMTTKHNQKSWTKIESLSGTKPDGRMDFDELSRLVKDHEHGTISARHPYQFITYCIKSDWLRRSDKFKGATE